MRSIANAIVIFAGLCLVMSCGFLGGGEENSNANENTGNVENAESAENTENAASTDTSQAAPKSKNVRVRFRGGSTMRSYSSPIATGGNHTYSVGASKGQTMRVEISSKNNNAKFKVIDPAGKDMRGYSNSAFSGTLPSNGNYRVVVTSDAIVTYNIGFNISALPKATPTPQPPAATPPPAANTNSAANVNAPAPVPSPT